METPKRFACTVLGCRTNQYELQATKTQLEALGFVEAAEGERADLCIIHTCAVTEAAESSSRHAIRSLVARHPGARIAVTGCLATRDSEGMRSIEGVTDVIAGKTSEEIVPTLFPDAELRPFGITRFDGHTRVFIKVQDGCNAFCTYCTVPFLRGRSRSRSIEDIVQEATRVVASGHKEIVLTGVNIGDFEGKLSELVAAVDGVPGLKRLRVSSLNPNDVDEPLIDVLTCGQVVCPALHLVLQSGSNTILERMRRQYTREQFLDIVRRLRAKVPDFSFSTDIIVGFPGETTEDFYETLSLVQEVQFTKVHIFPYSERPRTVAARLPDKVSNDVIKERKHMLLETAERAASAIREEYVGRVVEVLTENGGDQIEGMTPQGLPVFISGGIVEPNQLVSVRISKNGSCGLFGEVEP